MDILISIIFGIVEGITEWLPISSTGHLILLEQFLSFNNVSENFFDMFEVVIQFGAILAVVVMYWKNIFPFTNKNIMGMWGKILVACIPAAIIGLLFDDKINELFYNPTVIAIALIVFGIAFIFIENWNKSRKAEPRVNDTLQITYRDALIIGLFQLIAAIFPGTSRSGATIIGGLLIGLSRTTAAEFTFYLAIPVMFGASLLKLVKFGLAFTGTELAILIVGMVAAFIVSVLVIKFLMNYIKKHDFKPFGWYRIVLGILVFAVLVF